MKISWYPGHMHKAKKELIKIMSSTRVVIEVLDARAPGASSNPLLAELAAGIPTLKILNKSDLADDSITKLWLSHYESEGACLATRLHKQQIKNQIVNALRKLVPESAASSQTDAESLNKFQCVIFGIPNVGKSTLLNALSGRKLAKTGNEPAVTQSQQRIKLDENWYLVDTPGMMWPNLEDQDAALRLALTGTIRQTALDIEDVGWSSAELLYQLQPQTLMHRYKINEPPQTTEHLMQAIAEFAGAVGKKGSVDWHKTAETLLNDFRSGKLGKISLENPPASK